MVEKQDQYQTQILSHGNTTFLLPYARGSTRVRTYRFLLSLCLIVEEAKRIVVSFVATFLGREWTTHSLIEISCFADFGFQNHIKSPIWLG
jgi:hypothetical protein